MALARGDDFAHSLMRSPNRLQDRDERAPPPSSTAASHSGIAVRSAAAGDRAIHRDARERRVEREGSRFLPGGVRLRHRLGEAGVDLRGASPR